jgi:prevent-host-death family protein
MVSIVDMKAKLSEYVERAAAGERILICRHNKPVAELRSADEIRTERRPIGPLPGRPTFEIPASFFEPLPDDELDRWEGVSATDPLVSPTPSDEHRQFRVAEPKAGYRPAARKRAARRKS